MERIEQRIAQDDEARRSHSLASRSPSARTGGRLQQQPSLPDLSRHSEQQQSSGWQRPPKSAGSIKRVQHDQGPPVPHLPAHPALSSTTAASPTPSFSRQLSQSSATPSGPWLQQPYTRPSQTFVPASHASRPLTSISSHSAREHTQTFLQRGAPLSQGNTGGASTPSLADGLRLPEARTNKLGVILPTGEFIAGISEEDLNKPLNQSPDSIAAGSDAALRSRQQDSTTLAVLDSTRAAKHPSWQLSAMPHPALPQRPTIHILRHFAKERRRDEELRHNLSNAGVKRPILMYPGVRYAVIEQQRRVRTTGWITALALFLMSQLNPHGVPFAFSQLGMVPGALVVVILGSITCLSYFLLSQAFLEVDSVQYPVKTLHILAQRILGRPIGALIGVAQTIQLLMIASSLLLSSSRLLSQLINGVNSEGSAGIKLCFSIILPITVGLALVSSSIRRLNRYLGISHALVVVLVATCAWILLSAHHYGPALANGADSTVHVFAVFNRTTSLKEKVKAVMQIAFAFGGGIGVVETLSEMRRPTQFKRSLAIGQVLTVVVYLIFGPVLYAILGQNTILPSYLGLSNAEHARIVKGLTLLTNLAGTAFFGNIGAKLLYVNLIDRFDGPLLISKTGRAVFYAFATLFWALSFVIVAIVPQAGVVIRFTTTLLILPFSVAIPVAIHLGLVIQRDAASLDAFDPATLQIKANDAWIDGSRWERGLARAWYVKVPLAVLVVLMLCLVGLGGWAMWFEVRETFALGVTMAIGCSPPAATFFHAIR